VITDVSGNPSLPVAPGPPGRIVAFLSDDNISPVLQDFDFDLNAGNLTLYFSEPVNPSSFNFAGITLQSDQGDLTSVEYYQPMAGTVTSRDGMSTLVLVLSPEDINAIKGFASLGLNTTTFLSIDSSAVTDLATRPNPVATFTTRICSPSSNL